MKMTGRLQAVDRRQRRRPQSRARCGRRLGWLADMENRNAALTIFTGQAAMGSQIHDAYDRDESPRRAEGHRRASESRHRPHRSEVERSQPRRSAATSHGPPMAGRTRCAPSTSRAISSKDKFRSRPRRRHLRRHRRLGAGWHVHDRHHPPVRLGHARRVLAALCRPGADLRRREIQAAADDAGCALLKEATRDYRPGTAK